MVALGGGEDVFDGFIDGVVLVVSADLFDGLEGDDFGAGVFGFDFLEDGEVANEVEQGVLVEHPGGEDFEFVGVGVVVDAAAEFIGELAFPLAEAAFGGGEGACAGGDAVGDDEEGVVGEEAGDFALVSLELVVGGFEVGFGVGGVFEFDDDEGQAVDEEDDVGAAVVVIFDEGELVHREEVVVFGGGPVDQPELFAFGFTVLLVFDGDAAREVAVKGFVVADQVGAVDVLQFSLGGGAGIGGDVGVDAGDRGT